MGQYEVDQFDPAPDPDLVCIICHCIFDEPRETPCCHVFCNNCIKRWLERRHSCPTCRAIIFQHMLLPASSHIKLQLNRLIIRCANTDKGCHGIPLEIYPEHKNNCAFEMLKCTFSNCDAMVLRRDLKEHEQDCEWRQIRCQKSCGLLYPVKEKEEHDCLQALKDRLAEYQKLRVRVSELEEVNSQLRSRLKTVTSQLSRVTAIQDDMIARWMQDLENDFDLGDRASTEDSEDHQADANDASSEVMSTGNAMEYDFRNVVFDILEADVSREYPIFTADTMMPIFYSTEATYSPSQSMNEDAPTESEESPQDSQDNIFTSSMSLPSIDDTDADPPYDDLQQALHVEDLQASTDHGYQADSSPIETSLDVTSQDENYDQQIRGSIRRPRRNVASTIPNERNTSPTPNSDRRVLRRNRAIGRDIRQILGRSRNRSRSTSTSRSRSRSTDRLFRRTTRSTVRQLTQNWSSRPLPRSTFRSLTRSPTPFRRSEDSNNVEPSDHNREIPPINGLNRNSVRSEAQENYGDSIEIQQERGSYFCANSTNAGNFIDSPQQDQIICIPDSDDDDRRTQTGGNSGQQICLENNNFQSLTCTNQHSTRSPIMISSNTDTSFDNENNSSSNVECKTSDKNSGSQKNLSSKQKPFSRPLSQNSSHTRGGSIITESTKSPDVCVASNSGSNVVSLITSTGNGITATNFQTSNGDSRNDSNSVNVIDSDSENSLSELGRPWLASSSRRVSTVSSEAGESMNAQSRSSEGNLRNFVVRLQEALIGQSVSAEMPPPPQVPSLREARESPELLNAPYSNDTLTPVADVEVPGAALFQALMECESESEGEDYNPENETLSSDDESLSFVLSDVDEESLTSSSDFNSSSDTDVFFSEADINSVSGSNSDDSDSEWLPD